MQIIQAVNQQIFLKKSLVKRSVVSTKRFLSF